MSVERSEHKVFLYRNDFNTMCAEVYRHQRIETGGNLFGLWTTSGNAVVHVVVGPGKNCKRTDVSFNQDIDYMKRVGEFLNKDFMMCHIGEWHSHHHLTLNKPSDGDRRTVRDNYPQGMKKFLVIIANIEGSDQIVLSPYFFTDTGHTCLKAEYQVLDADSPFTMDSTIARELDIGSENPSEEPMETTTSMNNHHPASKDNSRSQDVARQNSGGNSPARNSSTTPQGESLGADSSKQQNTDSNPSSARKMAEPGTTSRVPSAPPLASQKPPPPTRGNENENQTRKEITIKKIFDWIRSNFHLAQELNIERNPSGVIEMKFKHKSKSWLITFPKRFPEEPAKIHCCNYSRVPKPSDKCHTFKPNSLNNYIDILLSIKRNCSIRCDDCDTMTVESVTRADPSPSLFLTEKGNAMLDELNASGMADPGSFKTQIKYDVAHKDEANLEVSFNHSSKVWTVALSSTFPVSLAKINYKDMRFAGCCSLSNSSTKKLDSASKILFAISQQCRCEKCKKIREKK